MLVLRVHCVKLESFQDFLELHLVRTASQAMVRRTQALLFVAQPVNTLSEDKIFVILAHLILTRMREQAPAVGLDTTLFLVTILLLLVQRGHTQIQGALSLAQCVQMENIQHQAQLCVAVQTRILDQERPLAHLVLLERYQLRVQISAIFQIEDSMKEKSLRSVLPLLLESF